MGGIERIENIRQPFPICLGSLNTTRQLPHMINFAEIDEYGFDRLQEDFCGLTYVKRLLRRWTTQQWRPKAHLLLNHVITLSNVFGDLFPGLLYEHCAHQETRHQQQRKKKWKNQPNL